MKTIEEAAQEYGEKATGCFQNNLYPHCDETLSEVAQKDFEAGVEFAQRWIPVEDELPEDSFQYLCKTIDNEYRLIIGEHIKNWIYPHVLKGQITHFRPIEYK